MKKILVVCGQTGTGKTSLAFYLADIFNGELVSADSRQVYKKLDIGTGKDLLKGSRYDRRGFYDVGGIKIWGYDLVNPKRDFSVSNYIKFAKKAVGDILKRKRLPIIVGGTGLYIKGVIDGIPTALVSKNETLRNNLEGKGAGDLFEMLAQLDPIRAGSMNISDRANPRRLVRAVEIAVWKLENNRRVLMPLVRKERRDVLFLGLTAPSDALSGKIDRRIEKRIAQGLEKEIRNLLASGVTWEHQSMSSLGYRQWRDYFEGRKNIGQVSNDWKKEERRYAKRQLVWFKKDKRIKWFDVSRENYVKDVEKLVKKWYSSGDDRRILA